MPPTSGNPGGAPMPEERTSSEDSVQPESETQAGWHCSHFFYRFHRDRLSQMAADVVKAGSRVLIEQLDPSGDGRPARLQTSIVSGHKADFGIVMLDPDPRKVDGVHQALMSSELGPAIEPVYSFVSMTEVSEYVPTVQQYAARLLAEGETQGSPAYQAKLK